MMPSQGVTPSPEEQEQLIALLRRSTSTNVGQNARGANKLMVYFSAIQQRPSVSIYMLSLRVTEVSLDDVCALSELKRRATLRQCKAP